MIKCTIITIGDELLIGQVIDTNSAFIAKEFNKIGISINRRIAIGDSENEIINAIKEALNSSDLVITTGGLGPTKDDITKLSLCKLFNVNLKRDEKTFLHVKKFFESRGREFTDINQAQADIPENADVIFNERGTAPGIWIEHEHKIVVSLPGVPFEMEHLISNHIIAKLKTKFKAPALYYSYIQTAGLGESFLAKEIADIENSIPDSISLAYLPSVYRVNLRLSGTIETKDTIDFIASQIKEKISSYIYGDSINDIFKLVLEKLKLNNQTITFAESCTGGYLANEFTNQSSSSECFKGSYVVYSDKEKIETLGVSKNVIDNYSVYSFECVEDMLKKLLKKTNADYGITTSGIIEKSDTQSRPTVYIAYGNIDTIKTLKLDLFYPRIKNKEATAYAAMIHLYKDFLDTKI